MSSSHSPRIRIVLYLWSRSILRAGVPANECSRGRCLLLTIYEISAVCKTDAILDADILEVVHIRLQQTLIMNSLPEILLHYATIPLSRSLVESPNRS